jgi:hypothetical protein
MVSIAEVALKSGAAQRAHYEAIRAQLRHRAGNSLMRWTPYPIHSRLLSVRNRFSKHRIQNIPGQEQ